MNPHKKALSSHNLIVPPTPTPSPLVTHQSQYPAITMNYSEPYTNKDDLTSETWPGSLWDYQYCPQPSVPQSTHPDLVSHPEHPTAGSYPDFNAAHDAAFSLAPTTEMGAFANLPTQVDFTNQVSNQCIRTSTSTYPTVPQNTLDPWSMPGPCMFLSRIRYDPSYSPMRI